MCGSNEEGLLIYDTEEDLFFFWDGSQWIPYPGNGNGDQWGGQGKYFHPQDYNLGEELRFIQE
ncbi:MAG TPA: hypothetical protein DCF84_05400 [Bacteroidetes bacterium]|nr:hypothetical protein [Bacteroidota bacterium]|tara:strand:- start:851 stop:1039 length:189 start_codon:yes stop_codon:yes gene_type:complete